MRNAQAGSMAAMRRVLACLAGCFVASGLACAGGSAEDNAMAATTSSFRLTSTAFADGGAIPALYTCDGKERSPPLAWSGAPEGAASFALVVEDPDAPRGTWDHWLLWNVKVNSLPEGSEGGGTSGTNSWGRTGYGGPCPPSGTHRYVFRLYALDTLLELPPRTSKAGLLAAMKGHVLSEARLVGTYARG
jgi:Raf kinase inhibitor-like YbhB/YbcL family protein